MTTCAIDGCPKSIRTRKADPRGLCLGHHRYLLRFGTSEPSLQDRLFALTNMSAGPQGCWIWIGGKTNDGYGRFNNMSPHRLSYEFVHGQIPQGAEIDHACHVRACINPEHLRVVTSKQNKENLKGAHGRSGIRGVRLDRGRWRACVVHNRKHIDLGYFVTAEEAGEAARLKRLELFTHNDADRQAV